VSGQLCPPEPEKGLWVVELRWVVSQFVRLIDFILCLSCLGLEFFETACALKENAERSFMNWSMMSSQW
jgi:hypothetical protein